MSDEPLIAKYVTIKCHCCQSVFPLNPAMMHSNFTCLKCGHLLRASQLLLPDPVRVQNLPSKRDRDTQPISRGDTTQIERPEITIPERRTLEPPRPIDPLDLDDIAAEATVPGRVILRKKKPSKNQKLITIASIVAVVGAVAILLIIVVGMVVNRAVTPVATPAPAPITIPQGKAEKKETEDERAHRVAWENLHRVRANIEANKKDLAFKLTALREATTKHFADAQAAVNNVRATEKILLEEEQKWQAEYERAAKKLRP